MDRIIVEKLMLNVTLIFSMKKNETKNIMIECYNIIGGVNEILQSSKGMSKFIRLI